MFRLFASITDQDDKEFQESYGHASRWARRHDKSPELNYVAPTVSIETTIFFFFSEWMRFTSR